MLLLYTAVHIAFHQCSLILSSGLAPRGIPKSCRTGGAKQYDAKISFNGTSPTPFTLVAIEKTSSKVAEYVFRNLFDDCPHQGGCRISAQGSRHHAAACWSDIQSQQRWRCSRARLSVLTENRPARTAMHKVASGKFRALMPCLMKAATMKCTGCRWPVQSGVSFVKGAGRGLVNTVDEIPIQAA